MKSHQSRKFTLLELMIVISVILILISLMMPAFKRSQAVAHHAVCGSNMKQLYLVHILFANTHKGSPVGIDTSATYWTGDNFGRSGIPKRRRGGSSINIMKKPLNPLIDVNLNPNSDLKVVDCPRLKKNADAILEGSSYLTNMGFGDGAFGTKIADHSEENRNLRPCTSLSKVIHSSAMVLIYETPVYGRYHKHADEDFPGHFTAKWNTRFNMITSDGAFHQQQSVAPGQVDLGKVTLSNCATSGDELDPNCPRCH
ncbi:MAG: hypothetical protein RL095_152 [Verrucomicrobiota bacterium]|jgi:hypothetical protein